MIALLMWVSLAWAAKPAAKPAKMTSDDCLACHNSPDLSKDENGKTLSLYVNEDKFKASLHGSMFQCTDCHKDVKGDHPGGTTPAKVQCSTCHADEQAKYDAGVHAKAIVNGDLKAATCVDCHGSAHELLPASDPNSKVNRKNLLATCGSCHSKDQVMQSSGHNTGPVVAYTESVHGKAMAAGNDKAAVCTDCHGNHRILSSGDPKSGTFKFNVPSTCAKCHQDVQNQYMQSIHGEAVARGNWQAPVCTDCHGIHSIKPPEDPTSSVAARQLAKQTCAKCHQSMRMAEEFGMPGDRVTSYLASYHGLANEAGSTTVANCASCHGVHNILPSSDPRSTIAKQNLVNTCGKCHPGASDKFVRGKIHINVPLSADTGSIAVAWVRRLYLSMIAVVIGFMMLHNFLVWRKKAVEKREAQHRTVERMDTAQRYQHLVLLCSFTILAITGFALKYPDSWLGHLLGLSEAVRRWIHRGAALAMIAAGFYHVFYLITKRSGRKMLVAMLPEPKDAADLLTALRYYAGLGSRKPEFKRFNYAEKMEYWALVWGTIVMVVTGLALWFQVFASRLLPSWWLGVATAIHFYEAVLATLAILVWHFYMVFLDPDVYPMNWTWYDGKMDLHLYQHEHGVDTETITAAMAAEGEAELLPSEEPGATTAAAGKDKKGN